MTNVERQRSLDIKKYIESEKVKSDMSGYMPYCKFCGNAKSCQAKVYDFNKINRDCLCAKAYNKMNKSKR